MKNQEEIQELIIDHEQNPHLRLLQKAIAEEVTNRVHGKKELEIAKKASSILFGNSTSADLNELDEKLFLSVFEGVPKFEITKEDIKLPILTILAEKTQIFKSKGEGEE